jgi:hypothetical protein
VAYRDKVSVLSCRVRREPRKTSVKIIFVPAGVRNEHLPNRPTNVECYRFMSLFGEVCFALSLEA